MEMVSPVEAKHRFDPAYLVDQDVEDLATFFGMPHEACRSRLREYSTLELAARWRTTRPKTPQEILAFYEQADSYIWELTQWHASAARLPYRQALEAIIERYPPQDGWRDVLDFGCGIGTDSLFFAQRGYSVTLMDVDGPAFRFAKHRFQRRGIAARFLVSRSHLPELDRKYDIITCFDVFEHLVDPLDAARRLVRSLRSSGVLVQIASFSSHGGIHPHHLRDNITRFGGLRWHIHLASLGLRCDRHPLVYRRASGAEAAAQHIRFAIWRLTRIWPVVVPWQEVEPMAHDDSPPTRK